MTLGESEMTTLLAAFDAVNGIDISDAGNTRDNAYFLEGGGLITGSTGFGDDNGDYFRFIAPASGAVTVELSDLDDDLDDLTMEWQDQSPTNMKSLFS